MNADFVSQGAGPVSDSLAEMLMSRELSAREFVLAQSAMALAVKVDDPGPADRVEALVLALAKVLGVLGDGADNDAAEFFAEIGTPVSAEVRDGAESGSDDVGGGSGGGGAAASA